MTSPSLSSVLQSLSADRLTLLGRELGIAVDSTAPKERRIDQLCQVDTIGLANVLPRMTREELQAACRSHSLAASDRARAPLMARLMGSDAEKLFAAEAAAARREPTPAELPRPGQIARVRQRTYYVAEVTRADRPDAQARVRLVCLDDDAAGRSVEVLWERELGARAIEPERSTLGALECLDDPRAFGAFLHTAKWNCVTATDGNLFQAPLRAGIKLQNFQLVPLQTALGLPHANLFIADDVGLGKTIEAGLVMQELLLRQRISQILIVCPAVLCLQWRAELERRFGLRFEIYNRRFVARRRQERGFGVNPWTTFPRFIISYQTLRRPEYLEPLRAHLGHRAAKSLLVLDEAHTAAPASASKYAVDSNVTRVVRELAPGFEHRLFLSATPHNGHSNSFSALLEILDPQRFTRGVPVTPADLKPVMVRRLKRDIKELGTVGLPDRRVHQVDLVCQDGRWRQSWDGATEADLGTGSDGELVLSELLAAYRSAISVKHKRGELVLINLQKRLLSSVEAFARTLQVHAETQAHARHRSPEVLREEAAVDASADEILAEEGLTDEQQEAEALADTRQRSTALAAETAEAQELLQRMIALGDARRGEPGAKLLALVDWLRRHQCPGVALGGAPPGLSAKERRWSERRVLIFTEYGDTKRHLVRTLRTACSGTDEGEARVLELHGGMSDEARAAVQQAFNGDPAAHPVRILVCTDAAREGVNLQGHCADLFHFDVPWNPARLEQRNGRIDRTLQPAPEVHCHYFFYPQRAEDEVLRALVRKVAQIESELGSLGEVLHDELARALEAHGLTDRVVETVCAISLGEGRRAAVAAECDAVDARGAELRAQNDAIGDLIEASRARLDFREEHLKDAVAVAFEGMGLGALRPHPTLEQAYLIPEMPERWAPTLDVLRPPRGRDEPFWEWRRRPPLPVTFHPLERLTDELHHLHLEHPFIKRVLARFFSGHDLARVTVVASREDALVRAIAFGRLTLFGDGATRLHEELVAVAAPWLESKGPKHLRPFASDADRKALDRLETLLGAARPGQVNAKVKARLRASAQEDFGALWGHVKDEAESRLQAARAKLAARGHEEAQQLERILQQQRAAIARALRAPPPLFAENDALELRQWKEDRKHMEGRLTALEHELKEEPAAVEASYRVVLHRLEPVGLVYLWPASK